MNNIDCTPALATAFLGEIEEIEKVAFFGTAMKALRNTGKGYWKSAVKSGKFKFAPGSKGAQRFKATDKATVGDYLKFHGGQILARHPGKVLLGGGIGTAAAVS